ncbi:conserved hypothetical protein, partial [Ricinus communis]
MQQMDIFADSLDVMARNDVVDAILRRDAGQARAAVARLVAHYPDDNALPALGTLIRALDVVSSSITDHASLAAARGTLEHEITPAAGRALPASAVQAWLAPCWRALALRAAGLPFDAGSADCHPAALWLQAADWVAAQEAVARIPSWRRIPVPLAWMTEARFRLDGLDATWPLLAELAWLSPARFVALSDRLGDKLLDALRRQFDAEFAGAGDTFDAA